MIRPKSANRVATDDVRTLGGKELVLNRLVNHYKALSNVKHKVDVEPPHPHVDAGKNKFNMTKMLNQKEKFYNIRQTYKAVAQVKPVVDNAKPTTFNWGKKLKHTRAKEQFEDLEHVRRLNAMSKRILSLGKPHERKKNVNDPIANPTYFFRKPGDDKAIFLLSLEKFNEKLKEINKDENNKQLLGDVVYKRVQEFTGHNLDKSSEKIRPSTAGATFIKYNTDYGLGNKPQNTKNKNKEKTIYTHIFTNPEEIIKQHLKERVKTTKENEQDLLDLKKITNNLNKSKSSESNLYQTNKSTNLNSDTKALFPIIDLSKNDIKQDFQMKIVKYIIAKRIYKENDLEMLLKQLMLKNKNYLDEEEIKAVFLHVKEELDK